MTPGTLVTDRGDSSRYYRSVYRIIGPAGAGLTICRRIGQLVNGRLECSGDVGETHRITANLAEWR